MYAIAPCPTERKSGNTLWLMNALAPFGGGGMAVVKW